MELTNKKAKSFPWFLVAAIAAVATAIGFFSGDSMDLVMVSGNFETAWEPYTETMISDSLGKFFWFLYSCCFHVGSILYIPGWCVLIAALFTLVYRPMNRILLGIGSLCLSGFFATHFLGLVVYKIAEVMYCKAHLSETSVPNFELYAKLDSTATALPTMDWDTFQNMDWDTFPKVEVGYIPDYIYPNYIYTDYGYDYEAGAKLTPDEILPIIVCFFTALAFTALLTMAILYMVRQTGKITKIIGLLPAILCGASILVNVFDVCLGFVRFSTTSNPQLMVDMVYAWIPLFILFLFLWLGLLFDKRDNEPIEVPASIPEQTTES